MSVSFSDSACSMPTSICIVSSAWGQTQAQIRGHTDNRTCSHASTSAWVTAAPCTIATTTITMSNIYG
jgi:hypothetical protein